MRGKDATKWARGPRQPLKATHRGGQAGRAPQRELGTQRGHGCLQRLVLGAQRGARLLGGRLRRGRAQAAAGARAQRGQLPPQRLHLRHQLPILLRAPLVVDFSQEAL